MHDFCLLFVCCVSMLHTEHSRIGQIVRSELCALSKKHKALCLGNADSTGVDRKQLLQNLPKEGLEH